MDAWHASELDSFKWVLVDSTDLAKEMVVLLVNRCDTKKYKKQWSASIRKPVTSMMTVNNPEEQSYD